MRQCHITKQLIHYFSVNTRISKPSKVMFSVNITVLGLTNTDVDLKRMHQLYSVSYIEVYEIYDFVELLSASVGICAYAISTEISRAGAYSLVIILAFKVLVFSGNLT